MLISRMLVIKTDLYNCKAGTVSLHYLGINCNFLIRCSPLLRFLNLPSCLGPSHVMLPSLIAGAVVAKATKHIVKKQTPNQGFSAMTTDERLST